MRRVLVWLACAGTLRAQLPRPPIAAVTDSSFKFPNIAARTLANGLRVYVVENHSLPVVAARLVIAADSVLDPPGKEGLSAAMLGAMSDATRRESREALDSAQAAIGTQVTATRFTTAAGNFAPALGIMADLVTQPAFPADAIELQKSMMLRRLSIRTPATTALRVFYDRALGVEYPFQRAPTQASVESLTRADVVSFHDRFVRPNRAALIVVGDVTPAAVFQQAEQWFGRWTRGADTETVAFPPLPAPRPTTIYLADAPGGTQAAVYVGELGPERDTPDAAALDVVATVLGDVNGGRITEELRDARAFTYTGIPFSVSWRPKPVPVFLWGFAIANAAKVDSVLALWVGALRDVRGARPITPAELEFGRNARAGALPTKIETADSIATQLVGMIRTGDSFDALDRYAREMDRMTLSDVNMAAARYIDPDRLIIVVVGDRRTIEPALRAANIAPIVLVDDAGRPKP